MSDRLRNFPRRVLLNQRGIGLAYKLPLGSFVLAVITAITMLFHSTIWHLAMGSADGVIAVLCFFCYHERYTEHYYHIGIRSYYPTRERVRDRLMACVLLALAALSFYLGLH